jgi:hypothetical protein
MEDIDGLIGMDVFSQFLVTLDYPMHKLLLGPLPPRPGEAAAAPALKTSNAEWDDSEASEEPAKRPARQACCPGNGIWLEGACCRLQRHGSSAKCFCKNNSPSRSL